MKMTCLLIGVLLLCFYARVAAQDGEKEEDPGKGPPRVVVEEEAGDPDPFGADLSGLGGSSVRKLAPERPKLVGQTVLVRMESYDVKTATVIALLDSWEVKEGAAPLRQQVLDLSKTGEADVAEVFAATVEVGAKHTFESIREYIYPTEYEPGSALQSELPAEPEKDVRPSLAEMLDELDETIIPTAFETRNTGSSLEIDLQKVEVEEDTWDVSLAPESVEVAGLLKWGVLGAQMPQFTSFRSSTALRVHDGKWTLICTQTPRSEEGEKKCEVKRMVFLKLQHAR